MIPISVCIIARNEEKNIEKCLAPLMPYHFEIIVVDTGSTDRTKEIARKYTDLIYDFEWVNDFSAARNFSLKKASHNYVLILDCDEFLTEIDLDAVCQAIEEHPRGVGMLLRHSYYDNHGMRVSYPDRVERLFHKRHYHYTLSIHEQVTSSKTGGTLFERYDIPLTVDHVGYCGGMESMLQKVERNNSLLLKEIEKNPDDPYFYFQIGQSYNAIEDYENAYLYYKKAFELPIDPRQPWLPVMAEAYIRAMNSIGRPQEAIDFFTPHYDFFADDAGFCCTLGVSYLRTEQPMKAMMQFVKALQCPNIRNESAGTYIPYYNIGLINEMLGDLPSAVSFYQRAAAYQYSPAVERLKQLGIN
ncbi:MAG: glycosyltransferase [Blautia sp.]|nr:glycosyltransferase [Blautia sp.]MCM1200180.1 glycosyltransferase [Bacteroides fragilis]